MASKGSRKDPYLWTEYTEKLTNNTWHGGWVKNGDNLIYHTQGIFTYSGYCSKSDPVPSNIFNEMAQYGLWLGGWVLYDPDVKKYIASDGSEYDSTLGTQSNPCLISIYYEMTSNEIWEDGWVQESDGTIRYVQNYSMSLNFGNGSGCGCGSGSGNGSGSGSDGGNGSGCGSGSGSGETPTDPYPVYSGNYQLGVIVYQGNEIGKLNLMWSEGNTVGHNDLSIITISIAIYDGGFSLQDNHVICTWKEIYKIALNGSFTATKNGESYFTDLDTEFTLPENYRKNHNVDPK